MLANSFIIASQLASELKWLKLPHTQLALRFQLHFGPSIVTEIRSIVPLILHLEIDSYGQMDVIDKHLTSLASWTS